MYRKYFILISASIVLFQACNLKSSKEEQVNIDSLQFFTYKEKMSEKVYYKFPSSEEIFDVINQGELHFNPDLTNKIESADKYSNSRAQAINLGVYTSDLAYLTIFEKTKESLDYFAVINKLSNKLHISSSESEDLFNRIQQNLTSIDSLKLLARDSYNKIVEHFSITENEKTLAIITAGAYIECLYISIHLVGDYSKTNTAVTKLAEQKYAVYNLQQYMDNFEDYEYVKETIEDVKPVFDIFNSLTETELEETSVIEAEDGSLIFAGGKVVSITEEEFNNLKVELAKIRKKFVESF
ncbi:MAG: hypothetical protein JXB49_25300 [Bacteroidales bacterium]|nr:hypothetical protein [Bacteroidales bacterium]